jgi:IS5 family transposase
VMVDQGYRSHNYVGDATMHVVRTIPKKATRAVRRMLKHRAAVEPTIGHLKSDNRMSRNHLTGKAGDEINTLLAAAGYNLRKLLRWTVFSPVLALLQWLEAMLNFKSPLERHPLSP